MKYIVHGREVSRDMYYFCLQSKNENKSFVFLYGDCNVNEYAASHPEYDYYIEYKPEKVYFKGNKNVKQWFKKTVSWQKEPYDVLARRYERSKFKNTLSFEEWCAKNWWKLEEEISYDMIWFNIPTVDDAVDAIPTRKLVSVVVDNTKTVETLNKLSDVQYVLRSGYTTEIIYLEDVLEMKE